MVSKIYFYIIIYISISYGCFRGIYALEENERSVDGGKFCAGCTFVTGLLEQLAEVYNESVSDSMARFCGYFPAGPYEHACKELVEVFGPVIIRLFYLKETPDVICHVLEFCKNDNGLPQCHLFPLPKGGIYKRVQGVKHILTTHLSKMNVVKMPHLCHLPGVKFICKLFNRIFNRHVPILDLDGDGFSTMEALRGTSWRGRDCFDLHEERHPGAKPLDSDVNFDSNCNGIYGVESESGKPFEDLLCNGTGARGIATLGDSASAHFHIPPEWLRVKELSKETVANLPFVVENELDWPMMSTSTGYKNLTLPIIHGPVYSIYTQLRKQNRCNHRDFQNLCVNGADSFKMQYDQKSLSRHPERDKPLVMFYALVGNDVCNHYPDTVAKMTTAKDMRRNIMKTLSFLDSRLPNGSHVILIGLADGRVLYNSLHRRLHPIGELNQDVTYPDFYEYLNCLQISPCHGWMTSNETLRNLTSQRSADLSKVLASVASEYEHKFTNFDIHYVTCPFMEVIKSWEKEHGKGSAWKLIEPVDGFHPNQYAQALTAKYVWEHLEKERPEVVGDVNPHNERIAEIFGDQGGY